VSPDVSILVVTYQCKDEARKCFASLYETTRDVSFELIVLDNASDDGTVDMIHDEFPDVHVLALDENIGFGAGVNQAASVASGEYLLLLNPDTVVHPHAVEHLVAFARRHPEYGIYGGRTLNPDGTVNPGSCWGKPTVWSLACFAFMLSSAFKRSRLFDPESLGGWQRDSVREVDIVTGCLLLVPRERWNELGGFDTRFFMYGEEADFTLRAAKAGLQPIITPDSVITHEVGASSKARSDKVILLFQGKATLVRKHWNAVERPLGLGLLWLGVGLRALFAGVGARSESRSVWPQVWHARRRWLAGYPKVAGGDVVGHAEH
jgi:N-acetylglucosaminyl-diphospho-decaprenol L-rhamnosyltransferase